MKKTIAFLCVLTLVLGMLAGCGSQSAPANETSAQETTSPAANKEPVTIAYWYGNGVGEQEYTDDVEAELNKILSETPVYENIRLLHGPDTGAVLRHAGRPDLHVRLRRI